MSATNWHLLGAEAAHRRAGGRRRVNAERKARAKKRRDEIKELLGGDYILLGSGIGHGMETRLAAHFNVHRSTICRDAAALKAEYRREHLCLGCGTLYPTPLKMLRRVAKAMGQDICTDQRCAQWEELVEGGTL